MKKYYYALVLLIFILVFASPTFAQGTELIGTGATFPYPLYSKMFDVYHKEYGVKVNYQAIGSGGGIRQLMNKTVDFGASDAFLSDEKIKEIPSKILHIPICLGAVVVTYNAAGNPEIKFTPEILAGIFLGKINKWNDSKIKEINPDIQLPNQKIIVVHRSDGSGTTFIFTDYLSKISSEWKEKVGTEKSVNWPTGLGAKGNPGVAGLVKQIKGSIGYVELAYAKQNKMAIGVLKNKAGNFIKPSLETTSLAADMELPDDTRVSLTDSTAEKGYPIAGFTWILIYQEQNYDKQTKEKTKTMLDLLWWMTHQGQKYASPLDYAPLSEQAVQKAENIIKSVTFDGKAVWKE